jgi:hypothetical protein
MSIITVGIDLAKNVFAVHGINELARQNWSSRGGAREAASADQQQLPPCVIGMEACSGAHHWARQFSPTATPSPDGAQVRHALPHEWPARQERRGDAAPSAKR